MNLNWNLEGCFLALNEALQQDYFPQSTKDTLLVFLGRQVIDIENEDQKAEETVPFYSKFNSIVNIK